MPNITTAMVMAAGHGTRMGALTNNTCKALVRVGGKALIDHTLDRLDAFGVQRAIVNVHAFADKLEAHLKARKHGPKIIISNERKTLLETGGGVVKALPLLGDDPVLICNIDAVWITFEPVLKNLITAWNPDIMDELFLLANVRNALGFNGNGDFSMNAKGVLQKRTQASAPYIYAGIEIFKPSLAHGFEEKKFSRNVIWDKGLKRQKIFGHVMEAYWMHVGDPRAHLATQAVIEQALKDQAFL
ncbi:MAG: nucleotidyltransferase family protein [Robiginitomaculum sp.]